MMSWLKFRWAHFRWRGDEPLLHPFLEPNRQNIAILLAHRVEWQAREPRREDFR
jgi:hypothetical protein